MVDGSLVPGGASYDRPLVGRSVCPSVETRVAGLTRGERGMVESINSWRRERETYQVRACVRACVRVDACEFLGHIRVTDKQQPHILPSDQR